MQSIVKKANEEQTHSKLSQKLGIFMVELDLASTYAGVESPRGQSLINVTSPGKTIGYNLRLHRE